jgi:hypothetical protein
MAQTKIQSVQLSDTGVVPGTYTTANVTVDSSGRVTAVETGTPGDTIIEPAKQVVYGTGTGITSDSSLTYDVSSSTMTVGATGPASVESEAGEQLSVYSDTKLVMSSDDIVEVSGDETTVNGETKLSLTSTGSVDINAELTFNDVATVDGYVLTAKGPGLAPEWVAPAAASGPVEPDGQIVYGTGTGITSDAAFTFDSSTDTMTVGADSSALIDSADSYDLEVSGGAYLILTARDGNIELNAPSGTIALNSEVKADGTYGTAGQVLTSQGSGFAPTWADAGASTKYVFRFNGDYSSSFDGTLYEGWWVEDLNPFSGGATPPVTVSYNDTDGRYEVIITELGMWSVKMVCIINSTPILPNGQIAYGVYLDTSSAEMYSPNPTFNTRNITSNAEFALGPISAVTDNQTNMSWTEEFILNVGMGTETFTPQVYSFADDSPTGESVTPSLSVIIEKLNNYIYIPS